MRGHLASLRGFVKQLSQIQDETGVEELRNKLRSAINVSIMQV